MRGYKRPDVIAPELRDDDGNVINFGNRWDDATEPPEELYSEDRYTARFTPLVNIGNAVIDYLIQTFDIDVVDHVEQTETHGDSPDAALTYAPVHLLRDVTLQPRDSRCIPLRIAITSMPGLLVEVGTIKNLMLPYCGCDACDETWQESADDFESIVSAVADGQYRERLVQTRSRRRLFSRFRRQNTWIRMRSVKWWRYWHDSNEIDPLLVLNQSGWIWSRWRSTISVAATLDLDDGSQGSIGRDHALQGLPDGDNVIRRIADNPTGYPAWPYRKGMSTEQPCIPGLVP